MECLLFRHRTILTIACLNSTEDFGHVLHQKSDLYATRPDKDCITKSTTTSYTITKTVSKDRLSIKKTGRNNRKYTETPVSEIEEMNCSGLSKCSSFKKFPSQNNRTILTIACLNSKEDFSQRYQTIFLCFPVLSSVQLAQLTSDSITCLQDC